MTSLPSDNTFDTFVVTSGTRKAFEFSRALARPSAKAPQSLLLYGPPGIGKTHLLNSILQSCVGNAALMRLAALDLVERLVTAMRGAPTARLGLLPSPLTMLV